MDNSPTDKKINWRQFGKHWIVVFVLAVVAGFVIYGMLNYHKIYNNTMQMIVDWQQRRLGKQIQDALEKPYREDKYGGKTPEETFDMLLAALEKKDAKLASKYFMLKRQADWEATFVSVMDKPDLYKNMMEELRYAQNKADRDVVEDTARFSYTLPGNEYGTQIVIYKVFQIWKISEL